MNNKTMMQRDLEVLWHPCTQMKDHESIPMIPIKSGKGVYLKDFDNNSYIDCVSSWWVNLFGHSNEYINSKVKEQLDTLEHVIMAGFSHEPIITLSERLIALTPKGLDKCFYVDNGSSAVEAALKMSFHYHKNKGKIKPYFVALKNSYHGETLATLSVGDVELYKETYEELLIKSFHVEAPKNQSKEEAKSALREMKTLLEKEHESISAVIIEPLIQCAGYMKMYDASYITGLKALCEEYDIHLIHDEVAVGFGRTGTMFAFEQAGIVPDFIVLSKGITAGYMPLSVVMTSNEVYEAFYADYHEYKAFLQSHSYTGNALACAAANASLDLFEKLDVIKKNKETSAYIAAKLERFKELKNVFEVRQCGMVAAIETQGYDAKERIGIQMYQYGLERGVLLRPLGHVIYFMPPYVISKEEIDTVFDIIYAFLTTH